MRGKAGELLDGATVDNDHRGARPPSSQPDLRVARKGEGEARDGEKAQVKRLQLCRKPGGC